jgi:hypothetical protein
MKTVYLSMRGIEEIVTYSARNFEHIKSRNIITYTKGSTYVSFMFTLSFCNEAMLGKILKFRLRYSETRWG